MLIDTDHLHYWMQAIRQSEDPMRTLDAFWQGQIRSKEWLIENLKPYLDNPSSIDIHGGWVGVLASMLFQSGIGCKQIRSIDIDPSCYPISTMMNKGEEMAGKFEAVIANMCDFKTDADVIVNTSCEHINQSDYDRWLANVPKTSLLVLQSNNYQIPEHIRISTSLNEFIKQCGIEVFWSGELHLPLYTRYMIIGKKYV